MDRPNFLADAIESRFKDAELIILVDFLSTCPSLQVLRDGIKYINKGDKTRRDGITKYGDLRFATSDDGAYVTITCQAVDDPSTTRGFTSTSTDAAETYISAVWHVLHDAGIEVGFETATATELRHNKKSAENMTCHIFTLKVKSSDISQFLPNKKPAHTLTIQIEANQPVALSSR